MTLDLSSVSRATSVNLSTSIENFTSLQYKNSQSKVRSLESNENMGPDMAAFFQQFSAAAGWILCWRASMWLRRRGFFSSRHFLCMGCLTPARMMWRGRPYSRTAVRRSLLLSIVHGAYPVGPHWQPHMEGTLFISSSMTAEGCSRAATEGRGAHTVQLWLWIPGWGGELQGCMGEPRLGPGWDLFNGSTEELGMG